MSVGLLPTAIALLEAGQAALHFGEPSVNQLLAAAQELLGLVKLGEPRSRTSLQTMCVCFRAAAPCWRPPVCLQPARCFAWLAAAARAYDDAADEDGDSSSSRDSGNSGGAWRMDLRQYAALSRLQRLSLLLGLLRSEGLASDLDQHLRPFLERLSQEAAAASGDANGELQQQQQGGDAAIVGMQLLLRKVSAGGRHLGITSNV